MAIGRQRLEEELKKLDEAMEAQKKGVETGLVNLRQMEGAQAILQLLLGEDCEQLPSETPADPKVVTLEELTDTIGGEVVLAEDMPDE